MEQAIYFWKVALYFPFAYIDSTRETLESIGVDVSLESAKSAGQTELQELFDISGLGQQVLKQALEDNFVNYTFTVEEKKLFDATTSNSENNSVKNDIKEDKPTCDKVEYVYDLTGKLLNRLEWMGGLGVIRFESDYSVGAGEKFKKRDIVQIAGDTHMYIVVGTPGSLKSSMNVSGWENIYMLYRVVVDGFVCKLGNHVHVHEQYIQKYSDFTTGCTLIEQLYDDGIYSDN